LNKKTILLIVLIFIGAAFFLFFDNNCPPPIPRNRNGSRPHYGVTDNHTIQIGAFNIQVFGRTKREKLVVMEILSKIIREFDVVLIQEIKDSSGETAPEFLERINQLEGPFYAYIESPRLGRTRSKESYAYFYNTQTTSLSSDFVYNDTRDVFEREPYIASFWSGNFDFTLVGIHTKPEDAYNEIGNLTTVVESLTTSERDIIILGDLNADGTYFNEDNGEHPLKKSEYYWVVTNDMDTMTKTDWTYDRIILLNYTYNHEYIETRVFYYDQKYNITEQETVWDVSDHYPVYSTFNTSLSDDD
jgi:endonuclease/exonuclease/phosphatase family metal-dependent hydrolase